MQAEDVVKGEIFDTKPKTLSGTFCWGRLVVQDFDANALS